MTSEFKRIQREQYELFLRKQHDYGPQNIIVGIITLINDEDKRLSLMGIWFRINDKVERIKTLIMRGDDGSLEDEGLVDSYSDISNYGVITTSSARVVNGNKISYSQFSQWDKYPHMWKLNYVDKLGTFQDNIYTIFGTSIHETIQTYLVCYYERTIKEAKILYH